jgi:GH35 family endo-1,4-beta-xylanase
MVESLNLAIEKANISDEVVELILNQYGYTSTSEIKIKDYMNIVNDFKSNKKEV